jgi:zinc transport system substrate-binding protein
MKPYRLAALVTAGALALVGLVGCGSIGPRGASASAVGAVVTEFYPLQFIAERVAGDDLPVVNLAPPGLEPHDLELSPSQVQSIAEAAVVVYLGKFAPAVDEAVDQNAGDRGFDVASTVQLVAGGQGEQADSVEADSDHNALDPHFWLDPTMLGQVANALADRLAQVDPDSADDYAVRAKALVADLDQLDRQFASGLAVCASRIVVTSHSAFGYLAAQYNLEQYSVAGLEPAAEPSAARIAEVQDLIQDNGVTTVYFEPLTSSDVVASIATDLGIDTDALDPIESIDGSGDADYFSVMRANLASLRRGLGCS